MNHDTGYGKKNGINNTGIGTDGAGGNGAALIRCMATALLALTVGLCTAAPTVRAESLQMAEQEQKAILHTKETKQAMPETETVSRGNLIYRQGEKGVQIYEADFLLLQNRLSTIPDTVFEPACYTHTHRWEYLRINEETHTRHCETCGNAFDLVGVHKAERQENCTLSYDGAEYPGICYTCVCGYQWKREEAHTPDFEPVDENTHRSRCRLDGTGFCEGYEPVIEEHYAYYYKPCKDGKHHERICMDCGYQAEEECRFADSDSDGGNDGGSRRCWCGNVEKPDVETEEDSTGAETGGEEEDTETKDDTSGTETGGEKEGMETEEDSTGTENDGEKEDTETEGDDSDTAAGEPGSEEIPSAGEIGEEKPDVESDEEVLEEEEKEEQVINGENAEENEDWEQGGRYEE